MKLNHLQRRLWSVLKDTGKQMKQAQLLLVASSLAYTTILSIIPALAVSFAIFKAFGGMDKVYEKIRPMILSNLAEGSGDQALVAIQGFIENVHGGAIGVGGLVALILTTMSMLSSIETAINRIWQAPISRSIFQRVAAYWLFVTLGPLGVAVAIGFAGSSDSFAVTRILPSGTGVFFITVAIFFGIYKWVPNRPVHWQYALISAVVTSVFWNLARIGYAAYTKYAVSYDKIYGTLAAIPILLLWIFIVWLIILTGVSLSAALQKRLEAPEAPRV